MKRQVLAAMMFLGALALAPLARADMPPDDDEEKCSVSMHAGARPGLSALVFAASVGLLVYRRRRS